MNNLSDLFGGVPFDPAAVEPQDDFQVLPPGKYPVLIEEAEVKVNKKQTGHLIYLKMKILDGPGKGRYVFDQINIQNPSQQCVEIGLKTLSALARAIGLQAVESTTQLLNQVVVAHVKVKDEQNNVRTYSSAGQPGGPVAPVAAPVVPVATPEPAPAFTPVTCVAPDGQQIAPTAPATPTPAPVAAPVTPTPPGVIQGSTSKPPWER